ncbi:MAG: hydrogen peroxide-inducible genes activator [Pseudohongiellaceae bacterium]
MSIKHLNIRDLTYLCTVAEQLNFGKAADICAISQPAMSSRIAHIEDLLGCRIFERNRREVLVTEKGNKIATLAQSILDTADTIDRISHESLRPLEGLLRLGIISTLGPYLMPLILGPLSKQFKNLELQITEGLTDSLVDSLIAGSLDAVIAAKPIENESLQYTELFFEPFKLAAPKNHPLSARKPIPNSALNAKDMVLLSEGHCLSGQALSVCPVKKRQGQTQLQATSLETLRHMIASGTRYSLLPSLAVGKKPPLKSLIDYSDLADPAMGRTIILCSRKSTDRSADLMALATLIQDALPEDL